jgi:hypothetical protein
MLKALLVSTMLVWPFVAIAQEAKDDAPPEVVKVILTTPCSQNMTEHLNSSLVKDFTPSVLYVTPINRAMHVYVQTIIYLETNPDKDGDKTVITIQTYFKDENPQKQCVTGAGLESKSMFDGFLKGWEDYKKNGGKMSELHPDGDAPVADPAPTSPGTLAKPAPKFEDDPNKDD